MTVYVQYLGVGEMAKVRVGRMPSEFALVAADPEEVTTHPLVLPRSLHDKVRTMVSSVDTQFAKIIVRSCYPWWDRDRGTVNSLICSMVWSNDEAECATDEVLGTW